jgi:hypothetical protein
MWVVGAHPFLYVVVYCNSGILSSMDVDKMGNNEKDPGPPAPVKLTADVANYFGSLIACSLDPSKH